MSGRRRLDIDDIGANESRLEGLRDPNRTNQTSGITIQILAFRLRRPAIDRFCSMGLSCRRH